MGHPSPVRTIVDVQLADYPVVWAAAGHAKTVFPTTFDELVRITGGTPRAVEPRSLSVDPSDASMRSQRSIQPEPRAMLRRCADSGTDAVLASVPESCGSGDLRTARTMSVRSERLRLRRCAMTESRKDRSRSRRGPDVGVDAAGVSMYHGLIVMRVRRICDLSQRDLGVSRSASTSRRSPASSRHDVAVELPLLAGYCRSPTCASRSSIETASRSCPSRTTCSATVPGAGCRPISTFAPRLTRRRRRLLNAHSDRTRTAGVVSPSNRARPAADRAERPTPCRISRPGPVVAQRERDRRADRTPTRATPGGGAARGRLHVSRRMLGQRQSAPTTARAGARPEHSSRSGATRRGARPGSGAP